MNQPAYKIRDLDYYIEAFYNDPVGFVRVVIEAEPTREQILILNEIATGKPLSVRSGHGIGKSTGLAWAILWFLCTRNKPKIPCTAPTGQQLYDILWSEVAKWHGQMNPLFGSALDMTASRVFWKSHPKEAFAVAKVARKEQPEALSGMHADHLLYVIEEASGVADETFLPIEGTLTSPGNQIVMAGNPIRNTGYFYDSHHKDRAAFTTMHFNSETAERVSPEYPKRMARKYGKDSNIYKVRVLGDFATTEVDQLIDLEWLEMAVLRRTEPGNPIRWGLDPARFGDDATVLAKRHGMKVFPLQKLRKKDTMYVVGWVNREWQETPEDKRPDQINVDEIGIGAGVCDRGRELGLPMVGINVSKRARNHRKFAALRDEIWWTYRDFVKDSESDLPDDEELVAQSSGIKYKFDSRGRIKVEGKEEMKKRIGRSPDEADAIGLTLAEKGELDYIF